MKNIKKYSRRKLMDKLFELIYYKDRLDCGMDEYTDSYYEAREDVIFHTTPYVLDMNIELSGNEDSLSNGLCACINGVDSYVNDYITEDFISYVRGKVAAEIGQPSPLYGDYFAGSIEHYDDYNLDDVDVTELMSCLNEREKHIIGCYFGLDDQFLTDDEMTSRFGIKPSSVNMVVTRTIYKIKDKVMK